MPFRKMDSDYEAVGSINGCVDTTSHCQQKNYTILSVDDIQKRQEDDITRVSTLLSVSKVWATILLLHYNWSVSNVHYAWFADKAKVCATVGLFEKPIVVHEISSLVKCAICFEEYRYLRMFGASCGHPFCRLCWVGYITSSIKDGPGCLMLHCPYPACRAAVEQDMINVLVSDVDKRRYSSYLVRSYVEARRNIKWCPAPGCGYAVEFVLGSGSYDVTCNCTYKFCWNCLREAHQPVDCNTVVKSVLENSDGAEREEIVARFRDLMRKEEDVMDMEQGESSSV